MGPKVCMNTSCGANSTSQWKKGWELKSGQIADLCFKCGSAYENLAYCDTFHHEETGWRECSLCNKRLHCGCSASQPIIEIQDFGGVWCITCAYNAGCRPIRRDELPSDAQTVKASTSGEMQNPQASNKFVAGSFDNRNLLSIGNMIEIREGSELRHAPRPLSDHANTPFGTVHLDVKRPMGFVGIGFPSLSHAPIGPPKFFNPSNDKLNIGVNDMHEPQTMPQQTMPQQTMPQQTMPQQTIPQQTMPQQTIPQQTIPSLNISLGTPHSSSIGLPLFGGVEEGEKGRPPFLQPGQKPRHILPKPNKPKLPKGSEANKDLVSQIRTARPPAEGRLRNQLLPRYWPRITDQELQKLSGDLNSTIVPLFEKVLSASDASRIGRLVLPKACAEAYFPSINQSEGLPLKIKDIKGNEWTVQFRFWPNNNSRMYVLEGVTPCIQSMQLEAGDTVTFSRIDPGGKLVMGYRKAPTSVEKQDAQASASQNGAVPGDSSCSEAADKQLLANALYSIKGSKDNSLNVSSEKPKLENRDNGWCTSEKFQGRLDENLTQQTPFALEKKKSRNIGHKNKRFLMNNDDAIELRVTWDEAQDLLRPPPCVEPSVVMIEEFEFEEYTEPPVFGKRTIFTNGLSGEHNQWAQCDECAKWRKLPLDVLLPAKWSCSDNVWDASRSSCSAPEEIGPKEVDAFSSTVRDSKKRRVADRSAPVPEPEPSGLDALATAAVLGDPACEPEEPSSGATTRHPRHRPGCSCIVCIQPPSGKGNHKANCGCNVCSTVKRRFKTLMLRKKRRQVETDQKPAQPDPEPLNPPEPGSSTPTPKADTPKTEEGNRDAMEEIDLNSHPTREEDIQVEESMGILRLAEAATGSMEMNDVSQVQYQNGKLDQEGEPGSNPEREPGPEPLAEVGSGQGPLAEPEVVKGDHENAMEVQDEEDLSSRTLGGS